MHNLLNQPNDLLGIIFYDFNYSLFFLKKKAYF
jgi:hypothetical protein